jgi:hypothetical protein
MDYINKLVINKKIEIIGFTLIGIILFTFIFFQKVVQTEWFPTGDTLSTLGQFSYQFSAFFRGEYPIWNPLVRTGTEEGIAQALHLACPSMNFVFIISVIFGIKDVVFSFYMYLFLLVIIYAFGMYKLVTSLTNNRFIGVFAMFLSLSSSTVFFVGYHVSFILIIHTLPWIIYSLKKYFQTYSLKYLILLYLAVTLSLYSYQFFMLLMFLIILFIVGLIIYRPTLSTIIKYFKNIKMTHFFLLVFLLILTVLPSFFIFLDMQNKLIPISRVSELKIDFNNITYKDEFERIYHSLPNWDYFITLFSGLFNDEEHDLRHFVGPMAFPFFFVSLFKFRKITLTILLSGIIIMLISSGVFPFIYIFNIPGLSLIRNAHFLYQFSIFVIIIISVYGFIEVLLQRIKIKKVFILGIVFYLFLLIFWKNSFMNDSNHNNLLFIFSVLIGFAMIIAVLSVSSVKLRRVFISLSILQLVVVSYLMGNLSFSGSIIKDPYLADLKNRSNHLLKFSYLRPDKIESIFIKNERSDFGQDEYLSYVSLMDNSFKTVGKNYGFSSYPVNKNYILFTSLLDYEQILRSKFYFFPRCFILKKNEDLSAFQKERLLIKILVYQKQLMIMK